MDKEIKIEEFNSNWSKQFVEEKVKLKEILADNVISIEHIGSTSVVGLAAKPIIDIAIGVNDLDVVDKFIDPLKQIGYEFVYHREFPKRRFFRKGQWRAGTHHLHIYQFGGEEWNNQILFREYLIKNPDVFMKYNQLKLDLARNYRFDRVAYTENKAPFIQKVLLEAKEE